MGGRQDNKEERVGFLAACADIYTRWFPDRSFTLENFKRLPQDIADTTVATVAKSCIGVLIQSSLETFPSAGTGAQNSLAVISEVIKKLMRTYRVDSIDVEEELKARGFGELDMMRAKLLYI